MKIKSYILTLVGGGISISRKFSARFWARSALMDLAAEFARPGVLVSIRADWDDAREGVDGERVVGYWEDQHDGTGWDRELVYTQVAA